jgi:hypothetical protein
MRLKEPVEFLYLALMLRWERTAPKDKHQGVLDGATARNTQISRFAYVLSKVGAGNVETTYGSLEQLTQRTDGRACITRDSTWMIEPYPLQDGWHFEGCCSLEQKKQMLGLLLQLGLSPGFIECACDFVEGKSVDKYLPTLSEENEVLARYLSRAKRE